MRRRRLYLVLAAILLLGVVAYLTFSRDSEPSYGGRSLSRWVDGAFICLDAGSIDAEQAAKSSNAICQIGTNAVPCLMRWLIYEPPPAKEAVRDFCNRWLDRLPGHWHWRDPRLNRVSNALWAFECLQPHATAILPYLTNFLYKTTNALHQLAAIESMVSLGRASVPCLITILTNQQLNCRTNVPFSLIRLRTNAVLAIPVLCECMRDKDAGLAEKAALALGMLKLQPEVAVPALEHTAQDAPSNVRRRALSALGNFGPAARSAVPTLEALQKDPDPVIQKLAAATLLRITPPPITNQEQPQPPPRRRTTNTTPEQRLN